MVGQEGQVFNFEDLGRERRDENGWKLKVHPGVAQPLGHLGNDLRPQIGEGTSRIYFIYLSYSIAQK